MIVMVIAVMVRIMVGTAAIDVRLGLGAHAQQHLQRQLAAAGLDHLDRRRQFFGHLGADLGQAFGVDQVGLVQHHQVGAGQLVGEQFVQRRLVVQVGVELALGIDLVRVGGEGASGHRRAVDHRDHRVDGAGIADFRPLEGLHQRFGQGQAAGFDEDMVQVATACHQLAHHREELFLHGAAQAAVGQLVDATGGFFFGATDAALLEDFAVDAQFAELVDDHRNAAALGVVEHVAQQGSLARAEEAGDDGDGELGQCFHVALPLADWRGHAGRQPRARPAGLVRHRITPPG
ncbi:hypothetical protein D3C72_632450 [compost metagenome]